MLLYPILSLRNVVTSSYGEEKKMKLSKPLSEKEKVSVSNVSNPLFLHFPPFKAEKISLKREAAQPKKGYFYDLTSVPETIQPVPYVDLV